MALMKDIGADTVSVGGVQVRYYDSAPRATDRETLVMLHGATDTAEDSFWAVFPMLAMRHRVVTLDFIDPDTPQADPYVDQVLAVVQAVSAGRAVHVAGYSLGAVIAALFAARHAQYVASLTLVAGWLKTDTQQQLGHVLWRKLHASDPDALALLTVLQTFSPSFLNLRNEAEIAALIARAGKGADRSTKMAVARQVDISDAVATLHVPSLVIGCTYDQTAPVRHARLLFSAMPNCRYTEINAGHGVVYERPAELYNVIDRFVRDPQALPAGHIVPNIHV